MARGRKTGGRVKGSLNKVTTEFKQAVAKSGESPLEYMIRVMRDNNEPLARRDDMAKAAAPYVHPRLASKEMTIHQPLAGLSGEEIDGLLERIRSLRVGRPRADTADGSTSM